MIEKAHAKLNLFLNVVGRREDGYHELNMVTHPIELHDILEFKKSDQIELIGSNFENDIILKAAQLMKETFNLDSGVKISLKKNIPVGAGLGGGSADAAATLRAMNKLFKLELSLDELAEIGIQLGADVPICIYNRPALVKGIGEKIEFVNPIEGEVILVIPNESISTKEVFQSTNPNEMRYVSEEGLIQALNEKNLRLLNKKKRNDLENTTILISRHCREISKIIKKINTGFMMTGSGSVFYNLYEEENEVLQNAKELDRYAINWQRTQLARNL